MCGSLPVLLRWVDKGRSVEVWSRDGAILIGYVMNAEREVDGLPDSGPAVAIDEVMVWAQVLARLALSGGIIRPSGDAIG